MLRIAAAIAIAIIATPAFADDSVVDFSKGDAEMNAAVSRARETFEAFWERVADDDGFSGDGASIKVAVPYGDGNREHI